jgi:hypothetical protein
MMRGRPILTLMLCGALAGCGNFNASSLNPFNWWGGEEVAVEIAPDGRPVDPRPLVDQVTGVVVERTPGGVIVRATGLPPVQGFWSADLVPENLELTPDENGVLAFDFRAFPPATPQGTGSPRTRAIEAGYFLSNQALGGVRTVVVRAERNSRSVRP